VRQLADGLRILAARQVRGQARQCFACRPDEQVDQFPRKLAVVVGSCEQRRRICRVQILSGTYSAYQHLVGTGKVPTIKDPGFISTSVTKRWTSADFDWFMGEARQAGNDARAALASEDEGESAALWRRLFPNDFSP
jgi:hypothetical protein